MIISKKKLRAETKTTGFREEILEKVILLMDLLTTLLGFVVYPAMSSKNDFRKITLKDIAFDKKELTNKLLPMLSQQYLNTLGAVEK